ncbi:hypothetical protein JL720_13651 [Aureococcus anophagefferens]|nr:hypothetical protein JL720_13651 [Aureococcus anophagefferens]
MARLVATCALLALASSSELVLDGGDDGFSKSYYKSVDGVMGGKSSISISYGANSMTATGNLRTDGGGFAGCWRDIAEPVDVSSYAGIAVTYEALAASATPLALELRLSGGDTGGSWLDHRAVFALSPSADADGVGVATLPFDAFVPRYRGSERTGSLDLAASTRSGSSSSSKRGIRIHDLEDRGRSYVFNKGYMSQCDHVYAATARGLAASLGGGPREGGRLAAAVEAAEAMGFTQQDEIDRAPTSFPTPEPTAKPTKGSKKSCEDKRKKAKKQWKKWKNKTC